MQPLIFGLSATGSGEVRTADGTLITQPDDESSPDQAATPTR